MGVRGRDVIAALGGDDLIENVGAEDRVCAGSGNDVVRTRDHWQIWPLIDLGPGDDRIRMIDAAEVRGGPGDDRIVAEAGVGNLNGGPGDDFLRAVSRAMPYGYPQNTPCLNYKPARRGVHVDLERQKALGEGRDTVVGFRCVTGSRFGDVLAGTGARDGLQGDPPGRFGPGTMGGSATHAGGGDVIDARGGPDAVAGGPGDDRIYLGPGEDYANGDDGRDRIYGEDGADSLEGWSDSDYIEGGGGNDQIYGALYCAIGGNSYDTAGLWDGAPDELFGGLGDDYIVGDRGNDRIDGGPGHDWAQPGFRDGRIDGSRA